MVKAVIFDWGGVIAPNPNGGWVNVLMDMIDMSLEDIRPHWYAAGYENLCRGLITEKSFWAQLEASFGHPLNIDTSRVWRDGSALTPYPGFMEFIETLRAKGIKTAILSNTVRPLSLALRDLGHYDDFDVVVLSDEVGEVKPNTAIYERALKRLGTPAADCIYIDDIEKNLVPANKLGMMTILANETPADTIAKIKSLIKF